MMRTKWLSIEAAALASRSLPNRILAWLTLATLASAAFAQPAERIERTGRSRPEMSLVIDDYRPRREPLQTAGGWPLVIELTANENRLLGIGSSTPAVDYPTHGVLVFDDPDGCLSFSTEQIAGDCPLPWPFDETWVEYDAGWSTPSGSGGFRPRLETWAPPDVEVLTELAPPVGSAGDGYGYGRSPLLPGLVIVPDGGPGLVFDTDFELAAPLTARNLAGFLNVLGVELRNSANRTALVAAMTVPPGLLQRVWLIDASVAGNACGEPGNDDALVRIDGGPVECLDGRGGSYDPFPRTDETGVSVRIFLVNGEAPQQLSDLDGNGVIDARDAVLAGYDVISNQRRFDARELELGVAKPHFGNHPYDFDDDGSAGGATIPGGAARIRLPPR